MSYESIRIFPLGDAALTVEFGTDISEALNKKALALADRFERDSFPGFIECTPAYACTTVFYDLVAVRRAFPQFPTASDAVRSFVADALSKADRSVAGDRADTIEIPVRFDADAAPDLEFVAEKNGLSTDRVVDIFLDKTYRVFMLGFLPGFAYMGEVDERIATPRKSTPRLAVPKGSVGIAGRQTGIYSLESPGGWQIIGCTDVDMFTPDAASPTLLDAGDSVRFVRAE